MTDHESPELPGPDAPTFWNGERWPARQVLVTVADDPEFPAYWARPYVGTDRNAVEVTYGDRTFYLDDEGHPPGETYAQMLRDAGRPVPEHCGAPGWGWAKVTLGHGSPRYAHSSLAVVPGSVRDREGE